MGSSLPAFGQIDLDLAPERPAKGATPRPFPSFGEVDLDSVISALEAEPCAREPSKRRLKETPTHQSLEAVRLAEEESRIARASAVVRSSSGADLDDPFGGLVPVEDDPFGGLVPVEDDPFGGLVPVEDDEDNDDESTAILDATTETARLASMTSRRVPRLLVGSKEISKLPMDPRAAFVLGHVDGVQSMEEILDVCAMPEAEALEVIERLRRMGVISID